MASSATTTITSSSSAIGVKASAGSLATISFQPLSNPSLPPISPSLNPAELYGSNSSHSFSPTSESSPTTAEVTTSNPATTSPPQLTPFPDLNLQTANLLARLKNPSLLSNEELQSATADAFAALSAWKSEWLNIEDTERRERGLKPAAHDEIRPISPNSVRVGSVEPSPAAKAGPSRAPAEAEAEEERTITTRSPHKLMQNQINPSTSRRSQRAHKPRKFFGETILATKYQRRGLHEGARENAEQQVLAIAHSLPKQEATMAKPNNGLAGKRKREDPNKKGEEKLAAETSRQKKTRVLSAAPAPLQQPRVELSLILNSPEPAPAYPTDLRALKTEPSPRKTRSMSKASPPTIAKKTISQAASVSASALGGKRKCLHDTDDCEQAFPKAKKMMVNNTNRAPPNAQAPTPAPIPPEHAAKHARHSSRMREVWVKRRAEGTGGLYGGQPRASTVKKWKKKMEKMGGEAET